MIDFTVTREQQSYLLHIAREAIKAELDERRPDYPESPDGLDFTCGAFVTLKTLRRALRGCIGTMVGNLPVAETIREMACSSAFRDPRFPAVSKSEIDKLCIEISLLSPMDLMRSIEEIEIGTHGLLIRKGGRSGVLLPQVAVEQGWDTKTFLSHTCRKAGIDSDAWTDSEVAIYLFSAILFSEKQ